MDKLKLIEAILGSCNTSGGSESAFKIGEKIFVRTVTHFLTGRIEAIHGPFITLSSAAWIADTGRFHDALKTGNFSEVEPAVGNVRVNTESIIDCYEWQHPLPTEQK